MSTQSPEWKVEFISRQSYAEVAYEIKIREQVPDDLTIRDRNQRDLLIDPDTPKYKEALDKFKSDVSSQKAVVILKFLYQYEQYLSKDLSAFAKNYKHFLGDRWDLIAFHFPKLDQTTIAVILKEMSDTTIGSRLEDFERIGLVERSSHRSPHPKYARITEKGILVIESAIDEAAAHLAPLMAASDEPTPPTPPEPGNEHKRLLR